MKAEEIRLEEIIHIFELYERRCGPGLVPINETGGYAREVLDDLHKSIERDYRYGSKWESFNSKLQFTTDREGYIKVNFYANTPDDFLKKKFADETESEREKFDEEASSYLNKK